MVLVFQAIDMLSVSDRSDPQFMAWVFQLIYPPRLLICIGHVRSSVRDPSTSGHTHPGLYYFYLLGTRPIRTTFQYRDVSGQLHPWSV